MVRTCIWLGFLDSASFRGSFCRRITFFANSASFWGSFCCRIAFFPISASFWGPFCCRVALFSGGRPRLWSISWRSRVNGTQKAPQERCFSVPRAGIEPARYCYHRILSPARLPIPPSGQGGGRCRAAVRIGTANLRKNVIFANTSRQVIPASHTSESYQQVILASPTIKTYVPASL